MIDLSWFYKSRTWRGFLETLRLERTNADGLLLCEHCGKPILRKYDCIGHHKTELTEDNVNDANVALNPDNVMLIHHRCHNLIHERFEGYAKRVFLVYGSPCSGKTSFVDESANGDDLIVDVDRLYDAICKDGCRIKPGRVRANALGVRDFLIDQIRTRAGTWRNAWIIGGYPLKTDRERLCDLLGAEPIYCEATMEECLERCKTERPAEWETFIRDWFDAFTE